MRVEKAKFDEALARLLKTKPRPRKKIKTSGKGGAAPIIKGPVRG
jgi:hypothetical protein